MAGPTSAMLSSPAALQTSSAAANDGSHSSKEVQERMAELEHAQPGVDAYPRWARKEVIASFKAAATAGWANSGDGKAGLAYIRAEEFAPGEKDPVLNEVGQPAVQVGGRITAIRLSGKFLAFIDIEADGDVFQIKMNHSRLPDVTHASFQNLTRLLRRGDHITVRGYEATTKRGEPALEAVELPILRAPCLQRLPLPQPLSKRDPDRESIAARHVEMLTYPGIIQTIKVRSMLIHSIRSTLEADEFVEVQTPILSAQAGGASARPFVTTATEFADRRLTLRIAPELWLKRLVIGGLTQVFEIGPSFRNEGLDKTHNPEFTTCEFYATYLDIARLTAYTERILSNIAARIQHRCQPSAYDGSVISEWQLPMNESFPKLDFIPSINAALGTPLPNLAAASAHSEVLEIFKSKGLPIPSTPTLPRLLDKLCSYYLEPQCDKPTWIVNTPECLSPLSKSFTHPSAPNQQPVAARAELFIRGKEVVNCYEEENSPTEQRRKFVDQQRHARVSHDHGGGGGATLDDEAMQVDEDYIRALEWGLPPTGGWGCGIDRLVMLATGMERIGNVLSCGNLRAVTRGG